MSKVTSIAEHTGRTQDWSSLQMLRWMVQQIEDGEMDEPDKLVVAYMNGGADEPDCRVGSYHANASGVVSLSMLEMVKQFIVRDVFG